MFNEEENIPVLYKRLTNVFHKINIDYELIFIDDGSSVNAFPLLKDFQSEDDNVKVIKFTRNFGHHFAITAGMEYSSGKMVLIILLIGSVLSMPIRTIRHSLPGYIGVLSVKKGTMLLLINQLSRTILTLIAIIFIFIFLK